MRKIFFSNKLGLALNVSVAYVAISLLYILFSDYLVTSLITDIQVINEVSTLKGWGFVIISGLLIYLMIKKAQQDSADSEERFLLLADLTIEGIVLHKKGVVIDINNAFTNLFGYKRKELIGKNLIDVFIKEEYRQICIDNAISQSTEPYEAKAQMKNGQEIWIQIIGKPYRFTGKKIRVTAIRDITKQKNTEAKLRSKESFLKSIIDNEPECLKILGPEGELRYMNPAGLRMIEVDELDKVIGECVYPMIFKEHRDAFIDLTKRVFKGEQGSLQFKIKGQRGTILWLETQAVPIFDNQGNVESLLGITQNITIRKQAEDTIKNSEQRYKLLFENMITGFALHDIICDEAGKPINYRYLEANPAFEELTGINVSNIIGKTIKEILPQIEPYWIEVFGRVALTGESISYENYVAEIGKYYDAWVFSPQKGQFAVVFNDITIRKNAEKALAEKEKILLLISDGTPLIMILVDEEFRVIKVNQTALNISEKSEQDVLKECPGHVINCVNVNYSTNGCGSSPNCVHCPLKNTVNKTLATHEGLHKIEAKIFMGKDDNVFERNVLITTEFIQIDDKPSALIFIDDITERIQMQNVLKEKSEILLKAQQMAKMGEFHYDIVNKRFRLSPSLREILCSAKDSINYGEFIENMVDEDINDFSVNLENSILYHDKFISHFRRIKHDGELQYLYCHGEVEFDSNNKALKVFGTINDITEQKQAEVKLRMINYELLATEEELRATNDALRENLTELEEAKQKAEESDRLKMSFLANMSHEIRTPMNAIMGFADLLDLEDAPFDKRKKFTRTIRERTKDLLNIINDLLDISRIESNTLRIVETSGDINNVLLEITDFFRIKNEEIFSKPITFRLINELNNDENFIVADFERIKQILINLIENAFKFTESGTITLGCKLKDKNTLLFSVKDTGIGIPKDKQNVIFERFRQVDESFLTREYGGAGLGLSICKGIIELINGSIWVESEFGIGSTFYFTLPYNRNIDNKLRNKELIKKTHDFKGKTILIVEDTKANMELLHEVLESSGVNIISAENGKLAMTQFYRHPEIDLVLMDIRLPDSNGFDLTRKMLAERREIKVIAQTAYASSDDMQKCLEAGCIDFIAKPIDRGTFYEILENYLG